MIVLDTNVVSEVMKLAPDERILKWLDDRHAETLFITSVNLAELLIGIELLPDGKRKNGLREMLEKVASHFFANRILPFETDAAAKMAALNRLAVSNGYNILFADCQIAAIAALRKFAVATRDEAPFRAAGVPVINPWTI